MCVKLRYCAAVKMLSNKYEAGGNPCAVGGCVFMPSWPEAGAS